MVERIYSDFAAILFHFLTQNSLCIIGTVVVNNDKFIKSINYRVNTHSDETSLVLSTHKTGQTRAQLFNPLVMHCW